MSLPFLERPLCEICGSSERSAVLSRPFTDPAVWDFLRTYYAGRVPREMVEGATYEISRCGACGFLWQRFILSDEGMGKLYEEWIDPEISSRKRREADGSLFANYAREMEIAQQFFPILRPHQIRALDYGAGWGGWCLMAKAFGMNASGFEISGRRLGAMNAQGINTFSSLVDLPQGHFHFVNSEQCFEHVAEPLTLLKTLVGTLVPGGVMRLSVPNAGAQVRRLAARDWTAAKDAFQPLEHISCFTRPVLLRLARKAGLRLVHRPLFPMQGRDAGSFLLSLASPLYYRFRGTSLYFRKV